MKTALAKASTTTAAKPAKSPKVPKAPKQKSWRPLTPQDVAARLATGVHFSSKPVNTNARAVGVRLSSSASLARPLVGLVTTQLNRHVVDYQDGAQAGALLSQCASVVEGSVQTDYKDVPPEQIDLIRQHVAVLDEQAEVGADRVDARLRQVLFPTRNGYVALTPLHSSVFSAHLRQSLKAESEARASADDPAQRRLALLMVGGSKAQNVGRVALVSAMQRPMVFDAPSESVDLRAAYALFYRGVPLRALIHRRSLADLAHWREENRLADGHIASTAALRDEERTLVQRIATQAMDALEERRRMVAPFVEQLGGWASPDLDDFSRALLDQDLRPRGWPREFAQRLLRKVEQYKTAKDARPMAGFGDIDDYLDMMAEVLK